MNPNIQRVTGEAVMSPEDVRLECMRLILPLAQDWNTEDIEDWAKRLARFVITGVFDPESETETKKEW
jgi:hypothetical protein